MPKIFSKTYLSSDYGSTRYYFIGIGALVVILIVAAAAIFLSPDLQKNLNISPVDKLEKSRIAGQIVDINLDEEYFVIDDEDSGEEFLINLPDGTEIISLGFNGNNTYRLGDLELGQYIELVNIKYTAGGGSKSDGNNGSPGGGGPNNGGSGPSDPNVVDPDDWEDINVYFPFPAFSAKITAIDTAAETLTIVPTVKDPKDFEVLVTKETLITRIISISTQGQKNVVEFSELEVGWEFDLFPEEDPTESTTLTALLILVIKEN